jgi:hypothetical protein
MVTNPDGWILVKTYEKAAGDAFYVDVFNPQGVYVQRTAIDMTSAYDGLPAVMTRGRLHGLEEQSGGELELLAYVLDWIGGPPSQSGVTDIARSRDGGTRT